MRAEARRFFGVTTATGEGGLLVGAPAGHDLWAGLVRLGFLAAALAGMLVFAVVEIYPL
jgi:hypothetical protein